MMKWRLASSGCPAPNNSPAKPGFSMLRAEPAVPCRISTGMPVGSPSVV
jgi:hypothetical protein